MKVSLNIFGPPRLPVANEAPLIYISHGFKSDAENMSELERLIGHVMPRAITYRFPYNWRHSVVRSGAELADAVFKNTKIDRPLLLVGHSMGGLVSRVANLILTDPTAFADQILKLGSFDYRNDIKRLTEFSFKSKTKRRVNGIVTLATPNSGAFLQGQVSSYLALAQWGVNLVASLRHPSVPDLTTDRLFRFLQQFSTQTPLLSVSGSRINRFRTGAGLLNQTTSKLGLNLSFPNDWVVEDLSVDLSKSILPNEVIHHGNALYLHLRAYENCTSVTHSSIHQERTIADYIGDFASRC
jgi:triacylglycerol esterase/lipase EstA (alpha/beta hydrolase family)